MYIKSLFGKFKLQWLIDRFEIYGIVLHFELLTSYFELIPLQSEVSLNFFLLRRIDFLVSRFISRSLS